MDRCADGMVCGCVEERGHGDVSTGQTMPRCLDRRLRKRKKWPGRESQDLCFSYILFEMITRYLTD